MGHLFLLLLALVLTASAHASIHGHGKAAFAEDKSIVGVIGMIGSRPPSCAGRCRSCGHCEAVQVPISPQQLQKKKKKQQLGHGSRAAAAAASVAGAGRAMPASYDDHSNYKPLSWRCKCGRIILDP